MGEDLERIGDGVKNLSPEEAEAIYKDQDRGAVPCYDPPYDSHIEDEFAWHMVKYIALEARMEKQHPIHTYCADFRLDFYLEKGARRIGVECDGKAYHNPDKDRIRDTLILGTKQIDTLFRLRGKNIRHNIDDLLYLLSRYCPDVFSARGIINLETLVSNITKEQYEAQYSKAKAPFIEISNPPPGQYLDVADTGEETRPWEILLEARSQTYTNYTYYMFGEFWDIIKFQRLQSLGEIEVYFRDIPAMIEQHAKMLGSFSEEQLVAYRNIVRDIQIILYGKKS